MLYTVALASAPFDAFREQPVAAANGKVLDRPLSRRVIDAQMAVFQIGFLRYFS